MELIIGTIIGGIITILGYIFIPKWLGKFFKKNIPNKYFEIIFKIGFLVESSIYYKDTPSSLIKTEDIKIKIKAENEKEALSMLNDIIQKEIKIDLVNIKDLGFNG